MHLKSWKKAGSTYNLLLMLQNWLHGITILLPIHLQPINDTANGLEYPLKTKPIKKALDYSSGGRFNIEYTIEPPSRKKRILRALGRAWFDDGKKPYRLNGTLQDITDEVTSRKSIIKSENNLRNIVIQAPVAM